MIVAGIGCRSGCGADEIVALIDAAIERAGIARCRFTALAIPVFKTGEPGLREAAERLALPLLPVGREAMKAVEARCPSRSEKALEAIGLASVCEAAALAVAGPGGRLVQPRVASAWATCALAEKVAGPEIDR